MARYDPAYLDQLIDGTNFLRFSELSGIFMGSAAYDRHHSTYGMPLPLFVFMESQVWFSSSFRSGVWTYFEAAPALRQSAMLNGLVALAPPWFAQQYSEGMQHWKEECHWRSLDAWIAAHDAEHDKWLQSILTLNRSTVYEYSA